MSTKRLLPVFLILFALCFSVPLWPGSCAGASPEFSADMVLIPAGEEALTGKIFVKGEKRRHEVVEDGERQIMIIRPDLKTTWVITPDEKSYVEIPYRADDSGFEDWTPEREKSSKFLGEENFSGFPCKKFEVVEDGEKTTYWVSKKLGCPLKIETPESTIEYRNIKEGKIEDSMFDIPAGFAKVQLPVVPEQIQESE